MDPAANDLSQMMARRTPGRGQAQSGGRKKWAPRALGSQEVRAIDELRADEDALGDGPASLVICQCQVDFAVSRGCTVEAGDQGVPMSARSGGVDRDPNVVVNDQRLEAASPRRQRAVEEGAVHRKDPASRRT